MLLDRHLVQRANPVEDRENAVNDLVQLRLVQLAGTHGTDECRAVSTRRSRHLQVEPCVHGLDRVCDSAPVSHDESCESPFLAKDAVQKAGVVGDVVPIHSVVGGHERKHVGVSDAVLEGQQIELSQGALVDLRRAGVAFMLDLVADEVLDCRYDVVVLNTFDVCTRQLSGQHRVLREAFEVPTPEGVTMKVHGWREEDTAALFNGLASHDCTRLFDDSRVPGGAERGSRGYADRRRDARMVEGVATCTVRTVGRLDRRYAKSREARRAPGVDPYSERGLLLEAKCARQPCDLTRRSDVGTWIMCLHEDAPMR